MHISSACLAVTPVSRGLAPLGSNSPSHIQTNPNPKPITKTRNNKKRKEEINQTIIHTESLSRLGGSSELTESRQKNKIHTVFHV